MKEIPYSNVVKNLGIYLDSNLNWNTQIKQTSQKVFSIMHSLKRLKHVLPTNLKKILVETLVMPYFDYCDVLLIDLNYNLTEKLQHVHNMCIRYIFNIRKYDHVSSSFKNCHGCVSMIEEKCTVSFYSSKFSALQPLVT